MTDYICHVCNMNCMYGIERIRDMNLDPDSDDDYDRLIMCPYAGEMARFEKLDDEEEEE